MNIKSKLMILNDTFASKISQDENLLFQYVVFIENQFIKTLPKNSFFSLIQNPVCIILPSAVFPKVVG